MKKSLLFLFGLLASFFTANATVYYWNGGTFNNVTSWTTVRAGGGATPANFTTSSDIFIVQGTGATTNGVGTGASNQSMTVNAAWTFAANVTLEIEGGATVTATSLIASLGVFLIDNGGTYNHNATSGTANGVATDFPGSTGAGRIFGASSNVVINQWATATGTPVALPTIANPGWGNLTINVPTWAGSMQMAGALTEVQGNLNIQSTGGTTREFRLSANATTFTLNIGGNLNVSGGIFTPTSGSSTPTINVAGDITVSSAGFMSLSQNSSANIAISALGTAPSTTGALTISGTGQVSGTSSGSATITLKGNFNVSSTSATAFRFQNSSSSSKVYALNIGGNFNWTGTGTFIGGSTASQAVVTFTGGSTSASYIQTAGTMTFTQTNFVVANSPTGKTVTLSNALTLPASRTMTVASGATLATGVGYTSTGTTTINGTFQINQSGFATGTNFSYGSGGTLIFNNTSGSYGVNNDPYWPTSNGPFNVTVQGGGGITMNVARTVPTSGTTGTFLLVTGTNAVQGTALTLNGTVQINGGNFQTTPTYGSASTLIYNNGSTYTTSNEWTGGATQGVAAGSGIPANVTTQTTNLTLAGGRGVPGNITVGASGQLNLNASSGDLYIGGNLSNSGTWINNSRAVVFVNAGTSTVTASSGTQFFDYLLVNKTSGSVQLATGTNVTINTTAGDVLQMLNAGSLDINGNTLTLNNAGGNILTSGGARSITSTAANGLLDITAAKTVATTGGGTLSFGNNLTVAIAAGVNFGAGLSTINGTLKINTGGSASTNSPTYGSGSTLIYNTGNYNTSNEWIAGGSVGTGVPSNVTLTLAAGTNTVTLGGDRSVPGTLTLTTGEVIIGSNTLTAGTVTATSGSLTGSITSNLTLTGAGSSLRFTSGGTNNYLKNFTIGASGSATLATALNITAWDGVSSEGVLTVTPGGTLATAGFLSIRSNINGTARIAPGSSSGGYITGNVSVERYIPLNASKAWRLLASTTNGQSINTCWQEGAVGGMVNPVPGFGTKITAGASITTNLATAQTAGFDTLSAGVSLYRYNPATDGLVAVTATNGGNNIGSEPGYFLFIRGDRSPGQFGAGAPTTPTVLRQRGTLFQGDQTSSTGAQNYGLVRNPFPSRIDLTAITFGSNVVQAVQLWDPKIGGSYGVGGYQTLTKVGANFQIAPGGGSYGIIGSVVNSVESGAAFFIQSTSNTNNSITIPESAKIASSSNASFRPATPASTDQRVAFSLYANNAGNYDIVDGGLEFFGDTYSNSVTVEDVRKNFNFNENFGIRRDNIDLVVERRLQTNINDTIFFSMSQMRQINYRLDIEATNIDPILNTAILEDKYTNTNTTLDLTAVNAYTFTVDANAASRAADRFRIVFRQSVVVPVTFISVKAAQAGGKIAVEWKVANEVNTLRYEVEKSTDGTRFSKKGTVLAISAGTYNWMDENAVNGYNYYRIKSVDNNGQVKYTQVVKVQVGGKAGITVSPNPVQGNYVNIQINQPLVGKYGIRLTNIAGQAVYNRELMHNGGSASQSFVLPSALSNGVYQLEVVAPDNSKHVEKLIIQGN